LQVNDATLNEAREVLLQLAKSLRVHRLYDRGNEMVTQFRERLEERLEDYVNAHGPLAVKVRPAVFEMQGEQLPMQGIDEFALGLFRQGIMTLSINDEVSGNSLSRFLELLAAGLNTSDASDEDLVTLLWRAQLPGVKYTSVLGFRESGVDEDDELDFDPDAVFDTIDDTLKTDLQAKTHFEQGSDATRNILEAHVKKLQGADPPAELVEFIGAIRDESHADALAALLEVLEDVLTLPETEHHIDADETGALLTTTLEMLLDKGEASTVSAFADLLSRVSEAPEAFHKEVVAEFRRTGLSDDALSQWLNELPGGISAHTQMVKMVISEFAPDRADLIAEFADSAEASNQLALNEVLAEMKGDDTDYLVTRFRALEGPQAVSALRALQRVDNNRARQAVSVRLPGADPDTRALLLESLVTIEGLYDHRVCASLLRLAQRDTAVRTAIVATFVALGDKSREVVEQLWAWARSDTLAAEDPEHITALMLSVLKLGDEQDAIAHVDDVLQRRAWLRRRALHNIKLAFVQSLAEHGTEAALDLLSKLEAEGEKSIRKVCGEALATAMQLAREQSDQMLPESRPADASDSDADDEGTTR